jgi:hypothetical protein
MQASAPATPAARQVVAKQVVAKKVVATKAAAKKVVAKKTLAKKAVAKKVAAKKSAAKKTSAKQTPAKKVAAKSSVSTQAAKAASSLAPKAPAASGGVQALPLPPDAATTIRKLTDSLRKMGDKRPTKPASLWRSLKSLLGAGATEESVEVALGRLIEAGVVRVDSVQGALYPSFDGPPAHAVAKT